MKIDVVGWDNKKVGDAELSESIYSLPIRADILQRVVEWQRANKQAGTHKTKERPEVSGTTKKPFKQKGTGQARQGSLIGPHQVGGCRVHGPRVRSHAYKLNKKFRALGLKTALSSKMKAGKITVVKDAKLKTPKTQELKQYLNTLGLKSALIIDQTLDQAFTKSARNIKHIKVLPSMAVNVYDILRYDTLVLTETAVKALEERLA